MKSVKYLAAFVAVLFVGLSARSQQGELKLDIAYRAAMPVGKFKNLTDKTSFNGWEGALLYGVTNQVSVGLQSGFQDYYQKFDRQVYHGAGGDISAVITNSIQVIPLLAKAKYTFSEKGVVQPYAALGVGGSLVQYNKYYGQFADGHAGFAFTAQPEVGIQIPVGAAKTVGINIAAAYNYLPYKGLDANGLDQASLKAGVSVPLRR